MSLGKYVAVYFYEGETTLKGLDADQLKKVQEFRKEIQDAGLVGSYRTIPELQANLALHLSAIVKQLGLPNRVGRSKGATTTRATKRATASVPVPGKRREKPIAPQKKGRGRVSSSAVDNSGSWVLLNTRFHQATSVRQNKDSTFSVEIHSKSADTDSAISALRPHHFGRPTPVPFAHANDAWVVAVKEVEMISQGNRRLWTVTLIPQNVEYGGSAMEMSLHMGGRQYSADDIARLRAGRILLNDPPPVGRDGWPGGGQAVLQDAMLESAIQGTSSPASAKECILRAVYRDYKSEPRLFLQLARLAAIYFLKATGVVERVRVLKLGPLVRGKVQVKLEGVRRKKYDNVEPQVIKLEGECAVE